MSKVNWESTSIGINSDTLPLTAFWELSVAEQTPQFQLTFEYTVDNTEIITQTKSWWTVTQANAMAVLNTTSTAWRYAMIQSKQHAKYRAWFGWLLKFTWLFDWWASWKEILIWLADELWSTARFKNWFMFGKKTTNEISIFRFQGDTLVEEIPASQWNYKSNLVWTLNETKINIAFIKFQYLWAWPINFYVEDPVTQKVVLVHQIKYAWLNTTPSIYNPNFHFTAYVNNGAVASETTLKTASVWFFVEWKTEFWELHQPQFSSWTITKAWVTAEIPLFTIRNKALYASKTNFIDIILELVSISIEASSANNQWTIRLIRNATLTGVSYADINATNSVIELDTSATVFSWWRELMSLQLANKNDRIFQDLTNLKTLLNPNDSITIWVSSVNSATFKGSLLWKELF
jgi:hypothetical protein